MKTALIDRSLTGLEFREITKKSDVYLYADSLLEAGADYIEIGLTALTRLPKPTGSERYVYRIERPEEYIIANAFPFSYASIPLRLSYLISKIQIPVILEVNIGDVDPLALVKVVSDSIDLTAVSLLRLTGDFKQSPDEFNLLVNRLRMKYAVPVDICPLNNSMSALSTAITAYAARTGSVTLSFAGAGNFASLEEFLIALSSMYGVVVTKNYISGICKSAMLSFLISTIETRNLNLLMKHYGLNSHKIMRIDSQPLDKINEYRRVSLSKRRSATEKKLNKMKIDEERAEKIAEVLKNCGIDFYSDDERESEEEKKPTETIFLN